MLEAQRSGLAATNAALLTMALAMAIGCAQANHQPRSPSPLKPWPTTGCSGVPLSCPGAPVRNRCAITRPAWAPPPRASS